MANNNLKLKCINVTKSPTIGSMHNGPELKVKRQIFLKFKDFALADSSGIELQPLE